MAKVVVFLNSAALVSSMKYADLLKIRQYRPDALVLKDEETKEPKFMVVPGCGNSVGKNGVEFGSMTEGGYAVAEVAVPNYVEDKKEFVQVSYGSAIIALNKLEKTLPAVLAEINEEIEAVNSHIEVADIDGEDGVEVTEEIPEGHTEG